ncbi:MAG TPA: hypothetical protein VFH72_05270 [Candidatus Baltobacteraceae bacterium]|nr:hypothetical protein [Candidatus Baltobacteraceae bacterium]
MAGSSCTPIDTVNPNSDFAGRGFTAASFNGGDHLNIDASGCTYGIYLSPGSTDLHIDHAKVNNASRVQIFAEQVSGVMIDDTVVDGTAFGRSPVKDGRTSALGGIAFRGASGTVNNSRVYSTLGFGINIVANNACYLGGGSCLEPSVTVSHTLVDVSKGTSDGIDVIGGPLPLVANASILHSTVIGPNSSTLFGAGEIDIYGAQVGFGFEDARVDAQYDAAINNEIAFESYCSTGLTSLAQLQASHDRVSYTTAVTLPASPLLENQVLTSYDSAQIDAIFGPGAC